MARRLTPRDQVRNLTLPGRFSNRELARAMGVSEKTIRRVKTGERVLSSARYDPGVFDVLHTLDKEVRKIERREAKRAGFSPPSTPIQFPAERDEWQDPRDPKAKIPGDTITYDIEKAEYISAAENDILPLLKAYRDRAALSGRLSGVRFLVTTYKYRGKAVTYWWPTRERAQPDISRMTDAQLRDLFVRVYIDIRSDGEILKLRIGDTLLSV